ncbi:hypothetical protein [Massilia sp. TS11]|uniref:hypothetical protein n=1 Tax=Massilia sp. TS11 TaxID=2908003 RepID=UPI001EDB2183|nr:hypothetical protein [Massilia sp. TS11]MCG2585692.1 hypothetical protein [Massilia sp. TS11]
MGGKFFVYAVFVIAITTASSWVKLFSVASRGGGNSWVSHTGGGGGSYGGGYSGGGYGGGGHK